MFNKYFARFLLISTVTIIGVITSINTAFAASFTGLGNLADENTEVFAGDVSADGSVIVGSFSRLETEGYVEAFIWNRNNNKITMFNDVVTGYLRSSAAGISADGSVVVGGGLNEDGEQAFIWNGNNQIVNLGFIPDEGNIFTDDYSYALDVSDDGSTIVGLGNNLEAFVWDSDEGMMNLRDVLDGSLLSRANSVSGDGSIVVGASNNNGDSYSFIWNRRKDSLIRVETLSDERYPGSIHSISADGLTVVGQIRDIDENEAFIWNIDNGIQRLGDFLGGDFNSSAFDVSGDGSIVVGTGEGI